MPRTIRFHLDEHIDPAVAECLRRRGIDVTTTQELGLLNEADVVHLVLVQAQARVIVTNDSDFLRLYHEGMEHPGIAYCHQQSRSIGEIIRGLQLIWEVLEPEEMRNHVEFL